jgi:hypothetical protein
LLDQFSNAKSRKRLLSAMLEERDVIKFFVKEQNGSKENHRILKAIYDHETMK